MYFQFSFFYFFIKFIVNYMCIITDQQKVNVAVNTLYDSYKLTYLFI